VVGVNSASRTDGTSRSNSGVGFAVPSNTVKRVASQLITTGSASYSYMGVSVNRYFGLAELAAEMDMPVDQGVLIDSVVPGEPADQAGLRGGTHELTVRGVPVKVDGDIITAVDGAAVHDFDEMIIYLINETEVGQTVTLTVIRNGTQIQVPLTLAERPK
jgi:S1-C subfamily serine protease